MLNIQQNISLAQFTTFRVGGPAKYFAEARTEEELKEAVQYAKDNQIRCFVLGGGSNVLISGKGFDGLVIKISLDTIARKGDQIEVASGVVLSRLLSFCAEHDLSGMEWAAGIPGTVGGAVRGNVGAYGKSMADVIQEVKLYEIADSNTIMEENQKSKIKNQNDNAKIKNFSNQECGFSYRGSVFKKNSDFIILSAVLKLESGSKGDIQKRMSEIITQRNSKQPKVFGCAGCFFVNPVVGNKELVEEFEHEQGVKSRENKIPAGWLIEKVGLKGKIVGGAIISNEHANYIANTGNATVEDVIILSSLAKQQVRDKLGVQLMEEVQYVGFD